MDDRAQSSRHGTATHGGCSGATTTHGQFYWQQQQHDIGPARSQGMGKHLGPSHYTGFIARPMELALYSTFATVRVRWYIAFIFSILYLFKDNFLGCRTFYGHQNDSDTPCVNAARTAATFDFALLICWLLVALIEQANLLFVG
jgi:hypothetical protein